MESDGDTDKCIYTAEVKTSLYILDKKVKRLVHFRHTLFSDTTFVIRKNS